jgi:hypothetical protein
VPDDEINQETIITHFSSCLPGFSIQIPVEKRTRKVAPGARNKRPAGCGESMQPAVLILIFYFLLFFCMQGVVKICDWDECSRLWGAGTGEKD